MFSPEHPRDRRTLHICFCKAEKCHATAVTSDCLLLCSATVITTWTPWNTAGTMHISQHGELRLWCFKGPRAVCPQVCNVQVSLTKRICAQHFESEYCWMLDSLLNHLLLTLWMWALEEKDLSKTFIYPSRVPSICLVIKKSSRPYLSSINSTVTDVHQHREILYYIFDFFHISNHNMY